MARTTFRPGAFLAGILLTGFSISSLSGYTQSKDPMTSSQKDAFDKGMQQLDKAMEKLDQQLNDKKWQKDLDGKLNSAMEKLNSGKFEAEFQKAINKLDIEKMKQDVQRQVQESMSQVDMEKIRREVKDAMSKIDIEKMKAEAGKALNSVNWDEVKKEMKTAMDKINADVDLEKMRRDVDDAGRSDIRTAKAQLAAFKAMTEEMESDKLINRSEDYTIEFKDGDLLINGEKQKNRITRKYKKYFEKGNAVIIKEKDNLSIK